MPWKAVQTISGPVIITGLLTFFIALGTITVLMRMIRTMSFLPFVIYRVIARRRPAGADLLRHALGRRELTGLAVAVEIARHNALNAVARDAKAWRGRGPRAGRLAHHIIGFQQFNLIGGERRIGQIDP